MKEDYRDLYIEILYLKSDVITASGEKGDNEDDGILGDIY